jgi:GAF domain-containing protein
MKKRSKAGIKQAKAQPRKALKPKGRSAPKAMPRRASAPAGQETEVARLTRERDEALGQQAATADVLRIISSSPWNLDSVLETILANATRLCEANFGVLLLYDGAQFRVAAAHNPPPTFAELRRRQPKIRSSGVLARVAVTKQLLHIADCTEDASYKQGDDDFVAFVDLCGVRTLLDAPLLKKGELIGTIALYRQEVRRFTDQQVELVRNFAAQAVIAIENARLLSELRQRTADLTESLEQQTATSEVLQVISSSPGDLQPVFEAMLEKAVRICDAKFGNIYAPDGNVFRLLATHNTPPGLAENRRRSPIRSSPTTLFGRMLTAKAVVHVVNLPAEKGYIERVPETVSAVELGGIRTVLAVPMLKEDELVGAFTVYRQEVRPFTDKQIALVTNFAAQAVIAIENARLLTELRESLQEQTATAEVLQVINSSSGDLEPVFASMLEKAVRICDANFGNIYRWDGEVLHLLASHNTPPALADARKHSPLRPYAETPVGRMVVHKAAFHSADMTAMPGYIDRSDPAAVAAVELGGVRAILAIPMLKENEMIGSFSVYRQEVRPFTDKQIALVTNFAAQAVIAIENARLLNELRESLQEQTATSEVLQVISSSPGDLQPVFASMLEKAVRICDATFGNIYRWDGDALQLVATHNTPPAYAEHRKHSPFRAEQNNSVAQMITSKEVVHLLDAAANETYATRRDPTVVAAVELGGIRSALIVPMLKEDELVGAFIVSRQEVRPFTEKQIALVTNFAAQAVIAIENARLLNELRERTTDLTESLEQQTATSEVLQTISGSPGNVQPVFDTMLAEAVRICDATFGNIQSWDGETFQVVATHNTPPALVEARKRLPFRPSSADAPLGRLVASKRAVHIDDLAVEPSYIEHRHPAVVAAVERGGVRTALVVPLLKENEVVGAFTLSRQAVRPFTEKQIALVTNFAAQAVIAIENTRLLNELRESLQEQTATAEVLQVINSSSGDLEPVFAAMLEKAVHICEAKFGVLYRYDDAGFEPAALSNAPPAYANFVWSRGQFFPQTGNGLDRLLRTKAVIHSVDEAAEPVPTNSARLAGARSQVLVSMLKEGKLAGAIAIYRQEVRPFSDKQIEAVKNFAAQAVIAIENTRLLKELRQRTEEVEKLNQHLEQRVADQVGEIERMGRLRRFLPPQVADLIVASGTEKQLESHRREITALFCDLRGFTGFTEVADAEDVMALLREYHAAVGEIIVRYNGTLERYAGDGIMIIFNDPIPVSNPALQAVQMALEMRKAIDALTEKWRQLGHEIGFGIGIAHGYATLGTIGFEGRFDYAAIGTVSNVASRLCDEAKPGQILISPRVLMAVKDAVTVEAVGEFELKGIRRPIAAYNVLAAASPTH